MRAVEIIARKRDGLPLSREEIHFFVQGFTQGTIPEYQAAAWLMAVRLRGMDRQETAALTLAIAESGKQLQLHDIAPFVVDKHSTGGVGDKTTLVVGPLVAAAGVPMGKISGRGLGFTGGTLDKLESIPGFRSDLSVEEFRAQLRAIGLVVAGQSADLAPADGKLYALRDVTATVDSLPLIASSIMGKKIAAGADGIVLDVKVGNGSFMQTEEDALTLATLMVEIGQETGRIVRAVLSDMDQPLGYAVGNALELQEAIETLHGQGPPDFLRHCLTIATQALLIAGQFTDSAAAESHLIRLLESGQAWRKFREWIAAQGGDLDYVDEPARLPAARWVRDLPSPYTGYVAGLNARQIGTASMLLGGGRAKKGDQIDYAVGIVLQAKIGDRVEAGEPLLTIHANDENRLAEVSQQLLAAYTWSDDPVQPPPLLRRIVNAGTPFQRHS
ncbi:MAG: thymidine phosphorylase [Anaerolineae bacterium]